MRRDSEKTMKVLDRGEHKVAAYTDIDPEEDITLRLAMDKFGANAQLDQLIEECAELILAIRHYKRGRVPSEDVLEEMADVDIMLEQFRMLPEFKGFSLVRAKKLTRLKGRLAKLG